MIARRAPARAERQRDAERSRQALLEAALDEFSERGYAGARVADIAQRAGVNKQLINYYFGSKEGLYLAVQQGWLDREEGFAPPDLALADLVVRYLQDAVRDPRALRLLLWRGLADDSAPGGRRSRQPDLDRVREGRRPARWPPTWTRPRCCWPAWAWSPPRWPCPRWPGNYSASTRPARSSSPATASRSGASSRIWPGAG